MLVFDCEKLRHPHTGLYHFCDQLARALQRQQVVQKLNHQFALYLPAGMSEEYAPCPDLRFRSYHKYWLRSSKITLWHSAYQLTHYFPAGVPVLQTVHDLNYLYEPLSEYKRRAYSRRLKSHLRQVRHLVAISDYTRRQLLEHFDVGDCPVDVIYNGCNTYKGAVCPPETPPSAPFFFAVATILPKKNFHVLPCLLQGNHFHLYLAGNPSSYVERILAEARRWGVTERVHILGPICEEEKHWYLRHCEAFLFPSVAEGFGLPVLEAMQYGRPVFLSDHTCLPEIGGMHAYYFNHDFDCRAMQQELEKGLSDFSAHPQKAEQMKKYACSFSWDEAARKYIEIYQQMLQK